jgi:hypothetical protein
MAALNIVQTVELLNFASNAVGGIIAAPAALQSYMQTYLSGGTDNPPQIEFAGFFNLMNPVMAGADWTLAWGPAVYCIDTGSRAKATNTMFVAYSPSQAAYVVAVAGTNFVSFYDWLAEDLDVGADHMSTVPLALPYNRPDNNLPLNPSVPYISAATATGLSKLLAMTDPSTGDTLQQFLTATANAEDLLIFTGHSLGGALAPALAYQLYPRAQTSASGWKNVLVQPSAGASPGNAAYATAFAYTDGAEWAYPPTETGLAAPFDQWNVDYAGTSDLVPHAWNRLAQMYVPPGFPSVLSGSSQTVYGWVKNELLQRHTLETELRVALKGANAYASDGDYQNLTLNPITPAWGEYVWTQNSDGSWAYPPSWAALPTYPSDSEAMTVWKELDQLILACHTFQYANFFGFDDPPRLPTEPKSS